MSYDDIIYIILLIFLLILVERVFLNEVNFTDIKTKMIHGLKNSIHNGNGAEEKIIREGFNEKPFKHRGEGVLADNNKKDETGGYKLSQGDEQMIKTVENLPSKTDFETKTVELFSGYINTRATSFEEQLSKLETTE